MNITSDVLVSKKDLNGVTVRFICEEALSHLLEVIGIMS
jgi:hypothetical protein